MANMDCLIICSFCLCLFFCSCFFVDVFVYSANEIRVTFHGCVGTNICQLCITFF